MSDQTLNKKCKRKGKIRDIEQKDLADAFQFAKKKITELKQIDQGILASNPRLKLFDTSLYEKNHHAKYYEYATKNLMYK